MWPKNGIVVIEDYFATLLSWVMSIALSFAPVVSFIVQVIGSLQHFSRWSLFGISYSLRADESSKYTHFLSLALYFTLFFFIIDLDY